MAEKVSIEAARKTADVDPKAARSGAEDKSVVQEVDGIVGAAVARGDVEIHFEPQAEGHLVRTRDTKGTLTEVSRIPEKLKINVANRLKVVSGMDITKSRVPQSGFFRVTVDEKKIELYVYVMPSIYGESITVKVSYKQSATMRLAELGMNQKVIDGYRRALARGTGLTLVTGPPGSGKRTTIYASILEITNATKLVMGFDPVIKYEVPGMIQSKQEERSEFSFADGIAALMKQEPDIAYIGDISGETEARAVIQGAFAKRVVFGRMTANDSLNAIQNLVDMGIQPFLIAASLTAVVNQRLVRKLCPQCREPYAPDAALVRETGFQLPAESKFFRPKGCAACAETGYAGVAAIFEIYRPSEELNKLIVAKETLAALRARAQQEGMFPLKADGVLKALGGLVTLEDVLNSL